MIWKKQQLKQSEADYSKICSRDLNKHGVLTLWFS